MTATEFFDWWRTQMVELIPASLRGSWQNAKTTIALEIEENSLRLSAPPSQARAEIRPARQDEASQAKVAEDFLSHLPGIPQRVRLTLAPGEYLLQHLTLPRAAQDHLAEAVGYQLPQLTPFTADQLLYACGETDDSPAGDALSVWLVAIPRQRIAQALALIGQRAPDSPLQLSTPPRPDEKLVVAWSAPEPAVSPRRRMRLAWVGLIALWIAVLALHNHNRQQAQTRLDQTRDALTAQAREVVRLRDRLESAKSQAAWLSQRREHMVSPLTLLDTLTQQLDDQTWLQGLELRGRHLTLRGISSSPATLLETLEGSRLLRDVRFESAITRDGRGQGDRFNISARLERPAQDGGT